VLPAPPPVPTHLPGSDTSRRRKGGDTKGSRAETDAALDVLLQEVRSLREGQAAIFSAVDALRRALSPDASGDFGGFREGDGPGLARIRAGQGKTVLIVDDDPQTREAAVGEFRQSGVPVRAYADGNAALTAIAAEKPDVIVLELGLAGDMGGKDLVNMIKATMEWVDIPIVLWTREPVSTQKEARQIHGADEVVPKSDGSAALVARVINAFRRS
jgi:CheY-like chemotaxis protein